MTRRVTQAKSDATTLLVLAAIGLVGLFVARRYGVAPVLRTVNRALGIARVVRSAGRSAARPARRGRARRIRPKVVAFSKPGS